MTLQPAASGTDIHFPNTSPLYPTRFPASINSMADLVRALRQGECTPTLPAP